MKNIKMLFGCVRVEPLKFFNRKNFAFYDALSPSIGEKFSKHSDQNKRLFAKRKDFPGGQMKS